MSRFYYPGQKPPALLSRRPCPGSKTGTNSPLEPGQMARSVVVSGIFSFRNVCLLGTLPDSITSLYMAFTKKVDFVPNDNTQLSSTSPNLTLRTRVTREKYILSLSLDRALLKKILEVQYLMHSPPFIFSSSNIIQTRELFYQ